MSFRDDQVASKGIAITPSDTAFVDCIGLYIGVSGDVSVVSTQGGTAVVFAACPAGTILPIIVSQVKATGTTATSIVGFQA